MAGADIGIDLGTANVLVYVSGKGIVLEEPSVVAIDKRTDSVLAVGEEAKKMIGRTPGNIVAIRPLRDGVISDYDVTEKMLKSFIDKIVDKKGFGRFFMPRIMVCVPTGVTEVEKRAVEDATRQAGAREVYIIEEPIAAAIGAGVDISQPNGNMIIDIGGGTVDIAVISLGGAVVSESIKVGGDRFDDAIVKYMKITGRNLITGLPSSITINSTEMLEALRECVEQIVVATHAVLEKTPPELAADIGDVGIIMTGGGSLLYGLDKIIEQRTGITVTIADEPLSCVAKGTGIALGSIDLLETGGSFKRK